MEAKLFFFLLKNKARATSHRVRAIVYLYHDIFALHFKIFVFLCSLILSKVSYLQWFVSSFVLISNVRTISALISLPEIFQCTRVTNKGKRVCAFAFHFTEPSFRWLFAIGGCYLCKNVAYAGRFLHGCPLEPPPPPLPSPDVIVSPICN